MFSQAPLGLQEKMELLVNLDPRALRGNLDLMEPLAFLG